MTGQHIPPAAVARWQDSGLAGAIGRLARFAVEDFEVQDILRELCTAAATGLDVDAAGVMQLDGDRSRVATVSNVSVAALEQYQEDTQSGPCRDAMDTNTTVVAGSLDQMQARWPVFGRTAGDQDMQSVLALPLLGRGRCWGSLDLFWCRPHIPTDSEHAAARLLADVAVSYLVLAHERAQAAAAHAETAAAREILARRALYDDLTGLANRGLIIEMTHHALAGALRHGTSVALLFADVNQFKAVNDTYGHHTGDQVLQEIARRLRSAVRDEDTVGRLAGDEFLILCEHAPAHPDDIAAFTAKLKQRLQAATAAPITLAATTLYPTISIGIAISDGHHTATELMHLADVAMYQAKTGRPPHIPHPRT